MTAQQQPSNASTRQQQPSKPPSDEPQSTPQPKLRVARLRSAKGDPDKQQRSSSDLYAAPKRSKPHDAGLDLEAASHAVVFPGMQARIPHNLNIELPPGTFGMIVPRSSTLANKGLLVVTGIIDGGFRGEVQTVVQNVSPQAQQVIAGERLSQLLILPLLSIEVEEVAVLDTATDRGDAGFGSTGGFVQRK